MVSLGNLRAMCGEFVERATLARDLLAPIASQLSGYPYSRCVMTQDLSCILPKLDDLRADMAAFGAIEAIALCVNLGDGVVVFRDEASVAIAVHGQGETSDGTYYAVPPPYLALPICFIEPRIIEVALYPSTPSSTAGVTGPTYVGEAQATAGLGTRATMVEPNSNIGASMPLWMRSRHVVVNLSVNLNLNYCHPHGDRGGPPDTIISTALVLSTKSELNGPRLGADGHLWMDGVHCTHYAMGMEINQVSIKVVQLAPPNYWMACGVKKEVNSDGN
ncbi:hypothetical protein E2562_018603 [Oryza meyeriana var. granulata]|uniref:Uncharacterized protein n=1 Tax=Oryza meyeriana var. granulata TaxID=110450 RepID=A0A6G1F9L5_9ORYZ|nr:hypothetical protein E2562_018603 [Oryza meyeriana var. granulata]